MLFLFRSAPEVEKRIHSKLFRKFWRSRGTKEPAYITVVHFKLQRDTENAKKERMPAFPQNSNLTVYTITPQGWRRLFNIPMVGDVTEVC